MRLSNWCVLFVTLFLGGILVQDLRERYERQAFFTTEIYHRNVDRATEDALFLGVKEAHPDGSIRIEEMEVKEKFYQQVFQQFGVISKAEQEVFSEHVKLGALINQKCKLSIADERNLQEEMERILNEKSELEEGKYCLDFPNQQGNDWAQPLSNQAMYHFVELADAKNYPWSKLLTHDAVRFFLSGAKLVKIGEN